MKIYCDEEVITQNALVTYEALNAAYRKNGSELLFIEGSRTYDRLRYGKRDSILPFEFTFTDRYKHEWKVVIDSEDDTVNLFIPCDTQMLWYGADESPTRTRCFPQTQWAAVQFSWQDKTYLPPYHAGVRIQFNGYKDKSPGEWSIDKERWNDILDVSKRGLEITAEVIGQIE